MKSHHVVACLIVVVLGILLIPFLPIHTVYALAYRNLEIVFVVTDVATEQPIPNATILLTVGDDKSQGDKNQVVTLLTDEHGRAKFIREDNSCEDVSRPLRKTVTSIDLTWGSISATAEGYKPMANVDLYSAKPLDMGFSTKDHFQRVELHIPLELEVKHKGGLLNPIFSRTASGNLWIIRKILARVASIRKKRSQLIRLVSAICRSVSAFWVR